MSFLTWLFGLRRRSRLTGRASRPAAPRNSASRRGSFIPRLEVLEDRTLPSGVTFSPVSNLGISFTAGEAIGDFNGDSKPDLATNVGVNLGNGDGTLQATKFYGFVVGANLFVAAGDLNGDGKLDVVTADLFSHSVSVLLGNGDGTFTAPHSIAVGIGFPSVAVGDFNRDGKLDLAVANSGSNTVSVLLGNGDGTFQTAHNYVVGLSPNSVTVGDFNADGRPDLVVANIGGSSVSTLLGNGDGTFQPQQSFAVGSFPESVAEGDFNGDGKLDLATANFFSNTVSVLLGKGDGTFQAAQSYAVGIEPRSVAVGDFDGNGTVDLAVANELSNNTSLVLGDVNNAGSVSVLSGNGDGSFQGAQNFAAGMNPLSVTVGDMNGDGRPDLVVGNAFQPGGVLLNAFVTTTAVSGPASSIYAQSATFTATVTSTGAPVLGGTVTFLDGSTPISPTLTLDTSGQATFTIATLNAGSDTITAFYSGTPGGAGTTGFGTSAGSASLTVAPLPLAAAAVNFSATAGAPFTCAVATFTNPDPFGSAASYTATIDWGDGITSTGTITGTGTLTVNGSHTYADPNSYALSVQISHNLGNTTTATVFPTATVTSLGQSVQDGLTVGIGFWHNKNGQALINAFNGGPDSTALSSWLALAFPNLYGTLNGASNAQVASFYNSQFALPGNNLAAEVLATALNVYATTQSLGGTIGQAYGFTVTATGLGADSFNVGADGASFGVPNNTTRNVYELLEAVDQQAVFGVLYNGDITLQKEANDLFDALNKAGAI